MAKNIFWYFIWSIYLEEAWNKIVFVLKNYLIYNFEVYVISSVCLKENLFYIQELFSIAWGSIGHIWYRFETNVLCFSIVFKYMSYLVYFLT